jgi:hypothetical protein
MLLAGCGKVQSGSCAAGRTECDGDCVDTRVDDQNCGACHNSCTTDQRCQNGACVVWCPAGQTNCSGICVNTHNDPANCNGCGMACPAGQLCSDGNCGCPAGQTPCGGACVNTQNDLNNCGGCNRPCASGTVCSGGSCAPWCGAGESLCGGSSCINLSSDSQNCGACGKACAPGQVCVGRACVCPSGLSPCNGGCVDTMADVDNCGGCGKPCPVGQACVGGTCKVICEASLFARVLDPWGLPWDGLEHPADNLANATNTCAAIGGRLPTATELVRGSQTGAVGQSYTTNYLWSEVPRDLTTQIIVRMSDGNTNYDNNASTTRYHYRCVCPPPVRSTFTGNSCYGVPGSECFTLQTEGKRQNMDTLDRAPLPKGSAIWECGQVHAHLADYITYAEAIEESLPNGGSFAPTFPYLHTADDGNYGDDVIVKWVGIQPIWQVNPNTSVGSMTDFRPFRCVGVNYAAGTNPNPINGEYVGSNSYYKGESMDSAATIWSTALDTCYARGGHLARATELAELIYDGLPNGSNTLLWTSTQGGDDGSSFLALGLTWNGIRPRFPYYNAAEGTSWEYKSDSPGHPFRCIYYPIDAQYMGPDDINDCSGGCMKFTLPGATPATIWIDKSDRTGTLQESAINICRGHGGHLASERDMTEAIRNGLPNGSNSNIMVWDITYGSGVAIGMHFDVLKWNGVDRSFSDEYSTYMTWDGLLATDPYRCMWTNELR